MKAIKSVLGILVVTLALPAQVQAQSFLTNGLAAYYPLADDGRDQSGHGLDLSLSNVVFSTVGSRGSGIRPAASFDGQTSYAIVNQALIGGLANWSWTAWLYSPQDSATNSSAQSLYQEGNQGGYDYFSIYILEKTLGVAADNVNWPGFWIGASIPNVLTNVWKHLAFTLASGGLGTGTLTIFVNGAPTTTAVLQSVNSGGAPPLIGVVGNGWGLGNPNYPTAPWMGSMADLRFYNRALSTNEVAQLYQYETTNPIPAQTGCAPVPSGLVGWWAGQSSALDSTGLNNGLTQGGLAYAPGEVGQAFSFNGTDADVDIPASASLNVGAGGGMSVEAWIDPADVTAQHPLVEWNGGYFGAQLWLAVAPPLGAGAGALVGVLVDVNHEEHAVSSAGGLVVTNIWQHVALTYDKTTGIAVLYLNGTVVQQQRLGVFTPLTTGDLWLGLRPYDAGAGLRYAGLMDEVSVYDRALSGSEILAIYNAGSAGKCPLPPVIAVQPQSETVLAGATAAFTVDAGGSPPLSYQWRMNGNNIAGATASSFALTNVRVADSGAYSVIVSNAAGTVASSNADLTVTPACVPAPSGLVGWWAGEGNALDSTGVNNGVLQGDVTFVPGEVGLAFSFDGTTADVEVPASPSLNVGPGSGFTVEAWIMPSDLSQGRPIVEWNTGDTNNLYAYNAHFWMSQPLPFGTGAGCLFANLIDTSGKSHPFCSAANLLTSDSFQHIALTYDKSSGQGAMYLNGSPVAQQHLGSFTPQTSSDLYLGCRPAGAGSVMRFAGKMDEVSLYSRALSVSEILSIYSAGASGKCATPTAPWIAAQPQSLTVVRGNGASFTVTAGGTAPMTYQWQLDSRNIAGATASSLVLTDVQFTNAGVYSVIISNSVGVVTSSAAVLIVTYPPALVQAANASGVGSRPVTVPILLVANGNENALAFTLDFDPAMLTYTGVVLGSGANNAALVFNASQAGSGFLGVGLALPSDAVFTAGTQEVAKVTFTAAFVTNAISASVSLGNQVTKSYVVDAQGDPLPANFASGVVAIARTPIAGDVWPRPNGDEELTVSDWVLEGRYVAMLDYPTNASEFERADCAPRATGGDGAITIMDWVQVGRYMAGLDPLTPAGTNTGSPPGPMVARRNLPSGPVKNDQSRQLQVQNAVILQGQSGTVSVNLEALGDENALGFSLSFDPTVLTYTGASQGSSLGTTNGATFVVNDMQAASGRLGFVLGLQAGTNFSSGNQQVAKINFSTPSSALGGHAVALGSQPVMCQVSDANASALTNITYINGTVLVSQPPSLSFALSHQAIQLSWPLWASNFILQQASGQLSPGMTWSSVGTTPAAATNANTVTLPLSTTNRFYRLRQQ